MCQNLVNWCFRLNTDPGASTCRPQCSCQRDSGVDIIDRFDVESDGIEIGVVGSPSFGIVNHQMAIQRELSFSRNCLRNGQPETEIRHEMTIHHIHMDPVSVGNRVKVPREVRKVC